MKTASSEASTVALKRLTAPSRPVTSPRAACWATDARRSPEATIDRSTPSAMNQPTRRISTGANGAASEMSKTMAWPAAETNVAISPPPRPPTQAAMITAAT